MCMNVASLKSKLILSIVQSSALSKCVLVFMKLISVIGHCFLGGLFVLVFFTLRCSIGNCQLLLEVHFVT